jgi:hypothetical protein
MEVVFRAGKILDFSGVFRPNSCCFWWETAGSHRDSSRIFRPELLLPFSIDFGSFLPETVIFPELSGGWNHRPGVFLHKKF